MKAVINRKDFLNALTIGGAMSSKVKSLTILELAKITFKDNYATVSSFDGEVAITKRVEIQEYSEDIVFCVNPKDLLSILKTISDEVVIIDVTDKLCVIIHAKGSMSLPCEDADEYPTPYLSKDVVTHEVEANVLYSYLKEAVLFIGTNTLYPQLMGVNLMFESDNWGVASTDMNVLYYNKKEYQNNTECCSAIISEKSINAILPMINNQEFVKIMFGSNTVMFKTKDSMVITTKSELNYPNFKIVIPNTYEDKVYMNKGNLLESVNRTMLMTDKTTNMLKFDFRQHSFEIQGEDIVNAKKSKEVCDCKCGVGMTIAFKGDYFIKMLNVIDSDNIALKLIAHDKPAIFIDELNENKVLLQMPYMIIS